MGKGSMYRVAEVKTYKSNFDLIFRKADKVEPVAVSSAESPTENGAPSLSQAPSPEPSHSNNQYSVPWEVACNAFNENRESKETSEAAWQRVIARVIEAYLKTR